MAGRLDGKVAVITGATSGIGEATARLFAAEGAALVIAGRAVDKGEALARELGTTVVFQRADVLREADIAELVDAAVTRFGRLDCLFNNAGAVDRSTVESVTEEDCANTMKLLVGGVVFGIKHAARVMKPRNRGSIINNSSIAAHRSGQGAYLYSAAKAAVSHVTRLAGVELGPYGVRVNAMSRRLLVDRDAAIVRHDLALAPDPRKWRSDGRGHGRHRRLRRQRDPRHARDSRLARYVLCRIRRRPATRPRAGVRRDSAATQLTGETVSRISRGQSDYICGLGRPHFRA
jgi:NAD(P)-dependent dehydrogenase (short-subunit alcohol dehydrogenase family)